MSELEFSTLYVDLESLFDLRLAVLYHLAPEVIPQVLTQGYHTRMADVFEGVDPKVFAHRYRTQTKAVLLDALPTPLLDLLSEFAVTTVHQLSTSPHHKRPKVTVNLFPYEVTDEEAALLLQCIRAKTHSLADIELITQPLEALTPTYVKQHFALMVMYSYGAWLEYHSAQGHFAKVTCPEVSLWGPQLFARPEAIPQALTEAEALGLSPFETVELTAGPLINLKLLPVDQFSWAVKIKPQPEPPSGSSFTPETPTHDPQNLSQPGWHHDEIPDSTPLW
jgi:hypothetical protein